MDQIVYTVMARALQDDAVRTHGSSLVAWVVSQNPPDYPGKALMARLVTAAPMPYVMLADTLAELRGILPPGLERFGRMAIDPPDVLEVWFTA